MSYKIFIKRSAQKSLAKIDKKNREKIIETIYNLEGNPRPENCKKLKGREGWRIRIGNYRVIYEIDEKEKRINVLFIGHRQLIYKL